MVTLSEIRTRLSQELKDMKGKGYTPNKIFWREENAIEAKLALLDEIEPLVIEIKDIEKIRDSDELYEFYKIMPRDDVPIRIADFIINKLKQQLLGSDK